MYSVTVQVVSHTACTVQGFCLTPYQSMAQALHHQLPPLVCSLSEVVAVSSAPCGSCTYTQATVMMCMPSVDYLTYRTNYNILTASHGALHCKACTAILLLTRHD